MTRTDTAVTVGFIIAVAMFASFIVGMIRKLRTARRQLDANLQERQRLGRMCPNCGYDVRSAHQHDGSPVCPECGEPVLLE